MLTSWTKLLAVLTLGSTIALGACGMDDANSGEDTTGRDGTVNSDAVTSDGAANSSEGEQISVVNPDAIAPGINISVTQWQTDLVFWQTRLATCRPTITIDGVFGPMTTSATECFQRVEHLTADGIVGPATYGAMCSELNRLKQSVLFHNSNC